MASDSIRINKYLSLCGVTSRRGADKLIAENKVVVNNKTITEPGVLINPEDDIVKVDGVTVSPVDQKIYVLFNKPALVMTTLHDPFKRKTILFYLKDLPIRVYPIGRLDYDTEGVLLLTNDGDMAYRLAHPRYQVEKVYEAKVKGNFTNEAKDQIEKGIKLEDGALGKALVTILGKSPSSTRLRMILTEGRKREVKQLCQLTGFPVLFLKRVDFAGISARALGLGKWRYLKTHEIEQLKSLVKL